MGHDAVVFLPILLDSILNPGDDIVFRGVKNGRHDIGMVHLPLSTLVSVALERGLHFLVYVTNNLGQDCASIHHFETQCITS